MKTNERILNLPVGNDLVVSIREDRRVRIIRNRIEPISIDPPKPGGLQFIPGLLLTPENSIPYLKQLPDEPVRSGRNAARRRSRDT